MKLYKQYCYEDISDVVDSIKSDVLIEDFGIVQNAFSTPAGKINVSYLDTSSVLRSFVFTPPECTILGFDNTYTGMSTDDAIEIGSLVTLALILAYSIKILRRGL